MLWLLLSLWLASSLPRCSLDHQQNTMSSTPVTTFWRVAGMSYLQYVNKAASTIRGALKEPAKRQAMANESLSYNSSAWTAGEQGAKSPVTTVAQAGK